MPILCLSKAIAEVNGPDIATVLGDQTTPPMDTKDMLRLTYCGDDPKRKAAFDRLHRLTGVIAEY